MYYFYLLFTRNYISVTIGLICLENSHRTVRGDIELINRV